MSGLMQRSRNGRGRNPRVGFSSSHGAALRDWIVGDEQGAIDLVRSLQSEGFLVPAICYPTVARGSARLRITVTAAHEKPQIQAFCAALARHADGWGGHDASD